MGIFSKSPPVLEDILLEEKQLTRTHLLLPKRSPGKFRGYTFEFECRVKALCQQPSEQSKSNL